MSILENKGICFGIRPQGLRDALDPKNYGQAILIAEGLHPVHGKDSRIEEVVKIDANAQPLLTKDGRIDFKSIDNVRAISEDDIIAYKHPPVPGKDGKSIFGDVIPASPGNDVNLPAGENTKVSPDGITMTASKTGYLYRTKYSINVGTTLVITGDVNYSTGHIKYSGDIIIKGSVISGFRVESTGSIIILGGVESAQVWSRNGNVNISQGVFGKGQAKIFAKKDINLDFGQETEFEAGGNINFSRYLLNCNTFAQGNITSTVSDSYILGGKAVAYGNITVATVGNDSEIKTMLAIHTKQDDELQEKLETYSDLEKKINQTVVKTTQRLKAANKLLWRNAQSKIETKQYIQALLKEYRGYLLSLKAIQTKKNQIEEKLNTVKPIDSRMQIQGNIYPKCIIYFNQDLYLIESKMSRVEFFFENKMIRKRELNIQTEK